MLRVIIFLSILISVYGCSLIKKKEEPAPDLKTIASKPLSPDETKELLSETAGNWFYGQGIGETALTVGTIVLFPPYAAYGVGNAALSVSGYEPLYITNALPDAGKKGFDSVYDAVTQSPGKVTAAVAGKEFRTNDVISEDMKKRLSSLQADEAKNEKQS